MPSLIKGKASCLKASQSSKMPLGIPQELRTTSGTSLVVRGGEGLDVIIREGRDRGAPSDLFLIDSEGDREPLNLTAEWDLMAGAPMWSPDGRFIYFNASISGTSHLFRVPANGGSVEQITTGSRMLSSFSFSADFRQTAATAAD